MNPRVDPAWFQRWNLKCDELLSKFAFNGINLRPFSLDNRLTLYGLKVGSVLQVDPEWCRLTLG